MYEIPAPYERTDSTGTIVQQSLPPVIPSDLFRLPGESLPQLIARQKALQLLATHRQSVAAAVTERWDQQDPYQVIQGMVHDLADTAVITGPHEPRTDGRQAITSPSKNTF